MSTREHWDEVYRSKSPDSVSWYRRLGDRTTVTCTPTTRPACFSPSRRSRVSATRIYGRPSAGTRPSTISNELRKPRGVLKNGFTRLAGGLSVERSGRLRLSSVADAQSAPSSPKRSTKSLPAQTNESVLQHPPRGLFASTTRAGDSAPPSRATSCTTTTTKWSFSTRRTRSPSTRALNGLGWCASASSTRSPRSRPTSSPTERRRSRRPSKPDARQITTTASARTRRVGAVSATSARC